MSAEPYLGTAPARPSMRAAAYRPPCLVDATFEELLSGSAHGDERCFRQLYDTSSARIYGVALRVVRDPAQAIEVTQDVYLQIWHQSGSFDAARGSAINWMLMLAHRRSVDRVRSAQASSNRDTRYVRENVEVDYEKTNDHAQNLVDAQAAAQRVRGLLNLLTEHQRQAILLAYFDGKTHVEIARALNIPLGTAKSRIRTGLIRLRDELAVAASDWA